MRIADIISMNANALAPTVAKPTNAVVASVMELPLAARLCLLAVVYSVIR